MSDQNVTVSKDQLWCLQTDGDSHWYVIPADRESEFSSIMYGPDPVKPDWAYEVGGSPSTVHFPSGWSFR